MRAMLRATAMPSRPASGDLCPNVGSHSMAMRCDSLKAEAHGLVRGVDDNKPERLERPTKYDFFEHAERNAIYNACLTGTSLKGCVMYATHAPCTDCARAIIQSGIKIVVTHEIKIDKTTPQNTWRDKLDFSRQMFEEAGVEYITLPKEN